MAENKKIKPSPFWKNNHEEEILFNNVLFFFATQIFNYIYCVKLKTHQNQVKHHRRKSHPAQMVHFKRGVNHSARLPLEHLKQTGRSFYDKLFVSALVYINLSTSICMLHLINQWRKYKWILHVRTVPGWYTVKNKAESCEMSFVWKVKAPGWCPS